MRPLHLAAAVLLTLAVAGADPGLAADPTNRIFNAEFDEDVDGWMGGAPDGEDRQGCAASGSAVVTGQVYFFSAQAITIFAQCIPVVPGETLRASIDARLVFATQPINAQVDVLLGGDCFGGSRALPSPAVPLPFGTWTRVSSAPILVGPGETAALVWFRATNVGTQSWQPFDVLFDRAYASDRTDGLLFEDHELGELCRYSRFEGLAP